MAKRVGWKGDAGLVSQHAESGGDCGLVMW
jgi:hypothetical protein